MIRNSASTSGVRSCGGISKSNPSEAATPVDALPQELPLLTVIVPAFNEERTIDELLRQVLAAPYAKQVIVVDDASTDGTPGIVEEWEQRGRQVELIRHPVNRGKGAAIRTGLQHAIGRFTIVQDADLEYDPDDYPRLIEPLLAGKADVVYGSRYLLNAGRSTLTRSASEEVPSLALRVSVGERQPRLMRWGVLALNMAVRCLYGLWLTDEATCYKAFPTAMLRDMHLQFQRFEFCPEVTAKACRMGLRVLEVPISYHPRSFVEGKKIRWRDGWQALKALWHWRGWSADRRLR
jgi:dolichol-phosphate mannosyltransferase